MKFLLRLLLTLTLAATPIIFFVASPASAAIDACTWTGLDSDDALWTSPDNWNCSVDGIASPEDDDTLIFPAGTIPRKTSTNDFAAGKTFERILIEGNSYNLSGNAIVLSGDEIDVLTILGSTNTIGMNITVDKSFSASISSFGSNNAISGNLALATISTLSIGVNTNNILTLSGNISGTFDNFIMNNSYGTVVYSGNNTFTNSGLTSMNLAPYESRVSCGSNTCFGNASNEPTTTGAATIITTGARTFSYSFNFNDGPGLPTIEAQDELTITGALDINTDTTISETDVSGSAKTVTANTGGIDIDSTATLTLLGGGNYLDSEFLIGGITGTGDVAIDDGSLELTSSAAFAGSFIVKSNGYLINASGDYYGTTAGGIIVENGGVLRANGAGTFTINDDITIEGTGNSSGSYSEGSIYSEAGELIINGDITLSGDTTFINNANTGSIIIDASITGTGNLTLLGDTVNDGFVFGGTEANDYVGTTTIQSTDLTIFKPDSIIAIPGDVDVIGGDSEAVLRLEFNDENVADNATINLDSTISDAIFFAEGSLTETLGIIKGDGVINLGILTPIIKVGADNESGTFTGEITSDEGEIEKVGTGTWNIQGTNTTRGVDFSIYRVSAGKLLLNFADTSGQFSPFEVNGGSLGGNDVIGPLTVSSGSVAPGNSPGCLNPDGPLTFSSGSSLNIEIAGSTICTQYDKVASSGAVTLGNSTLNITLGYAPTVGTVFTIVEGSSVSGTFNSIANGSTVSSGGYLFTVNYNGTNVTLTAAGLAPSASTLPSTGANVLGETLITIISLLLGGIVLVNFARSRRRIFFQ